MHWLSFLTVLPLSYTLSTNEQSHRNAARSEKGHWERHPLIGLGPRQEHSVVSIDSDIYIIGGIAYNDQSIPATLNRVEYYDATKRAWHVAAPVPTPLNHGNAAAVDGKIFVLGALSGGRTWRAMPNAYVYQPFNDTWLPLPSMPNGTARGSSAVGVYKGKVFLAGGMTFLEAFKGGHQNSVSMTSSFDTRTSTWNNNYPPLPKPRQHVGGAVVGSTFYVVGGRENGIYQYHNTTYALDLENPEAWRTMAPMPTARGSLACAALGHKIYCFGGEGNRDNPDRIFNETQVYNTRTDNWRTLEPMEVPRHGAGVAAVGNAIYYPGGGVTTAFYPTGIMDAFVPGSGE